MAELFCLFYHSIVSFNPWEVGTVIIPIFAERETEAQGGGC